MLVYNAVLYVNKRSNLPRRDLMSTAHETSALPMEIQRYTQKSSRDHLCSCSYSYVKLHKSISLQANRLNHYIMMIYNDREDN